MAIWRPDRDDPLYVAAWFDPRQPINRRVTCLKFEWHGRMRILRQIDFHHEDHEGERLLHFISAADWLCHYRFRFDADKYTYASSRVFSILKEFSPLLEVFSIDEAWVDISQAAERMGGPVTVAQAIKRRIREELGEEITCSIGIGPSKVLAKIAAEQKKPDGLTWIRDEELQEWLERLEVDAALGIGDRRKEDLAAMGIRTLADLGRTDPYRLRRRFGVWGHYLHLLGLGKDPVPLNPAYQSVVRKSVSHSKKLRYPYPDFERARGILAVLCAKAAWRLRAESLCGRVVHFYAASPRGFVAGRQRTLPTYISDEAAILATCVSIAEELERDGKLSGELTAIGMAVSRLCPRKSLPVKLFAEERRRDELLGMMDKVNNHYGQFALHFGNLLEPLENKGLWPKWKVASIAMARELEVVG